MDDGGLVRYCTIPTYDPFQRLWYWILIEADACTIPAMPHLKHTTQIFAFVVQSYKLNALYGRWAFRNGPYRNLSWEGQRLGREVRLRMFDG